MKLTKLDMANALTSSPAWDGCKDPLWLAQNCRWEQLHDYFVEIDNVEAEYYADRTEAKQ